MSGSIFSGRQWSFFLAGLLFFAPGTARALPQFDCHTAEDCDPGEYCRIPEQHDAGAEDAAPEDANFDAGWSGYCAPSFDGGDSDAGHGPPLLDAALMDAAAPDSATHDADPGDPPMADAASPDTSAGDAAAAPDAGAGSDASVSSVDAADSDEGMGGGSCECAQAEGPGPLLLLAVLLAAALGRRHRRLAE